MLIRRLTILSLALSIGLAGCAPSATPAIKLTPITVQLASTHQAQFAGLYVADQRGFYTAEGLAVTFVQGGAKVDKLTPVLNGSAQFGVGSPDELMLARSEGKLLKTVATIYRRSPVVFISLADKGITRPQDFVGKTIRAPANVAPSLVAMMTRVGINPDQYTVVDLPADLTLFASGDVPVWGVFLNVFQVTIEQAGYKINQIYPDDYGVHFYADSLFTTDNLTATQPDLVLRFVRATLKGWTYAVENPTEVSVMVQKVNPGADSITENLRMIASLPLVNTGEDHIGWMKPEVWTAMEKTLREQGVLTQPIDVAGAYTLQFLDEIYGK